ncbi:hypothetical protein FHG87_011368 [Trinorchestia longiramus]|nr:hypothetical protein FHG87_011368 [Trinorchestia longiramus]
MALPDTSPTITAISSSRGRVEDNRNQVLQRLSTTRPDLDNQARPGVLSQNLMWCQQCCHSTSCGASSRPRKKMGRIRIRSCHYRHGRTARTVAGRTARTVSRRTAGTVSRRTTGTVAGRTTGTVAGRTTGTIAGRTTVPVAGRTETVAGTVAARTAGIVAGRTTGTVAGTAGTATCVEGHINAVVISVTPRFISSSYRTSMIETRPRNGSTQETKQLIKALDR